MTNESMISNRDMFSWTLSNGVKTVVLTFPERFLWANPPHGLCQCNCPNGLGKEVLPWPWGSEEAFRSSATGKFSLVLQSRPLCGQPRRLTLHPATTPCCTWECGGRRPAIKTLQTRKDPERQPAPIAYIHLLSGSVGCQEYQSDLVHIFVSPVTLRRCGGISYGPWKCWIRPNLRI